MPLHRLYRNEEANDRLFELDGSRRKDRRRQDPARKAEGQRSLEICITCSNIKRPLVWPRRRRSQEDTRIATSFSPFRTAPSSRSPRSFSRSFSLSSPVRRIFFLLSSISAAFLARVLLSFPLNVSRIVASSKGCRAQKYLRA